MKTFFELQGSYEGLVVRRLKQFARVALLKVINDPPPYWFVRISGFNVSPKGRDRVLVELGLVHPETQVGNWRFTSLEGAQAKFEVLCALPLYQAEEEKAQNLRRQSSERMKRLVQPGKFELIRKASTKISTAEQERASDEPGEEQKQSPDASGQTPS